MKKNSRQTKVPETGVQTHTESEMQQHHDVPEPVLTSHEERLMNEGMPSERLAAYEQIPEREQSHVGGHPEQSQEMHQQNQSGHQRSRYSQHRNDRNDGYRDRDPRDRDARDPRDSRGDSRGGDRGHSDQQRGGQRSSRDRDHDGKRHYSSYARNNADRQPSDQHRYQDRDRQQQYHDRDRGQESQQQSNLPLDEQSLGDLNLYARKLGIIGACLMAKDHLIKMIKHVEENPDMEMKVEGVLEKLPDGFGFLRSSRFDYVSGPDDVYVSPSQIRRFHLRTGDTVTGVIRKPKEGEKYFALLKVDKVNFKEPMLTADRPNFDRLTPLYPDKKFEIEYNPTVISTRIMDIFTPLGHGQRGLIVAPPKVGKTVLLKELAQAFVANHPDTYLIVLLIDERPEEVADMRRTVKGAFAEVISSTFDESASRHVQVAELVLEKAKRLVEANHHVVILLDSITRLARAYNSIAPASGKVLTGGIDANALQRPKRFFGAARNTEEAGSLSIIASALVDTGSRMDEVIYEEFKGTGNMEMHMTRKLSSRRTYPAFDLMNSGTRRDDLLLSEEDLKKVWVLQKLLSTMNTVEGMEFLIEKMRKTKLNRDFFDAINKKSGPDSGS